MIQITNAVYLELHTFISQERISEFCCKWPCCLLLHAAANSFENGFSTAKELVYSVFDEECHVCETWLSHKSSVFSTSGCCWFYAGQQIVVAIYM